MVTAALSSRAVRRAASEAQQSVQSLGAVVNGNAELLKQYGVMLFEIQKAHRTQVERLLHVPPLGSTVWHRLRWLIRGA